MPGLSGFDILNFLHTKHYPSPVIIYSNITQRESVVQALSLGAKSFLVKPQKPDVIIQKSLEVINANS
jgi:DNA-binding response OmpR family regulator